MDVTPQAVSKWENDISCPDITALPKLADYFGVSVDELLRGEASPPAAAHNQYAVGDLKGKALRIFVNSHNGKEVNISIPLTVFRLGKAFRPKMNFSGNQAASDAVQNIDFDSIIKMAEDGALGKLMEITTADGDLVEIYIE